MEDQTDLQFPIRELYLSVLENMRYHYGKGIKTRAADKKGLYYLAPHGAKDPIGRLLTQIEIEVILDWIIQPENLATGITGVYLNNREKFPSLHKFSDKFLKDIQDWHDNDEHWDEKGVSIAGWVALEQMKEKVLKMQK